MVEHLPSMHKALGSSPSTTNIKRPGMAAHACNPSDGRMAGASLKFTSQRVWPMRDPASNKRWKVPEEQCQRLSSDHQIHMHTHRHLYTQTQTHTDHNCHPELTSSVVFWAIYSAKVFSGLKLAFSWQHSLGTATLQLGGMGLNDLWSMILDPGSSFPRRYHRGNLTSVSSNREKQISKWLPHLNPHTLRVNTGTHRLWNSEMIISRLATVPGLLQTTAGWRTVGKDSLSSFQCREAPIAGSSSGAL